MKIVYKIMLTSDGGWLLSLGGDTWKLIYNIDQATAFETHGAAQAYINELEIKSIWPQANVQSVGV